jgi:recombination protein RecA
VTATTHTAVIFINQLREKVGIRFGNPEVTAGGRALKFYASVRIDLRTAGPLNDGNSRIGNIVLARVVKNKVAAPFRHARFDVLFGQGISREGEILDLGKALGILSKKGAWYQWDGQLLGQGREAARRFLKERQDVSRQIEDLIRSRTAAPAFRIEETASYHVQTPDSQLESGSNHEGGCEAETETAFLFDAEEHQEQNET